MSTTYKVQSWAQFSQNLQQASPDDTILISQSFDCADDTIQEIIIGDNNSSRTSSIIIDGSGCTISNLIYNGDNSLFTIKTKILFKNLRFKNLVLGNNGTSIFSFVRNYTDLYFENCIFECYNKSNVSYSYDENSSVYQRNAIFHCEGKLSRFYFKKCAFDIILYTPYASFIWANGFQSMMTDYGCTLEYCNVNIEYSGDENGLGYWGENKKVGCEYLIYKVNLKNCYFSGSIIVYSNQNESNDVSTGKILNIFQDEDTKKSFSVFNIKTKINVSENVNSPYCVDFSQSSYLYLIFNIDNFDVPLKYQNNKESLTFLAEEEYNVNGSGKYGINENIRNVTDLQLKSSDYLKSIGMLDGWYVDSNVNNGYPWNDNIPKLHSDNSGKDQFENVFIGNDNLKKCFSGTDSISSIFIH